MARDETRARSPTLLIRGESGTLLKAADVAERIENFEATSEGTLRSIRGPCRLMPFRGVRDDSSGLTELTDLGNYSTMHGIFHALLMRGTRDVLLVHTGNEVRVFNGHDTTSETNAWEVLLGPENDDNPPHYQYELLSDDRPQFPTQFEATSSGVVIVPQDYQRAFFYDGEKVLPLGYATVPSPPHPEGPSSSDRDEADGSKTNDVGYPVSGMDPGRTVNKHFGHGRIGTLAPALDMEAKNYSLGGKWEYAVQWIDAFGNLSAISPRSNSIKTDRQGMDSGDKLSQIGKLLRWFWVWAIPKGRQGTRGRILYRTRDIRNSGTNKLFQVPGNAGHGTFGLFATIPDNISHSFSDNVGDGSLVLTAEDYLPVPPFKLCRVAFGRLFIANLAEEPGALMYSIPNKFGTFPRVGKMYPDPRGGEITALWAGSAGLLVFTQSSAFIIVPNDDGTSFRAQPVNMNVGCIAPSSMVNLPDNSVMWLGKEGFYRASPDGETVLVSDVIQKLINRINPAYAVGACAVYDSHSGEYRCWVPLDAQKKNSTCLIFDGENWRRRTTETAQAVCVTQDPRKVTIIAGNAHNRTFGYPAYPTGEPGVYVLDRETEDFLAGSKDLIPTLYTIETAWIDYARSDKRKTTKSIYLGLRERYFGSAKISVFRDYRKSPVIYTNSSDAILYKEEDRPAFWELSSAPTHTATAPAGGTTGVVTPVNIPYTSFDGAKRDQRIVIPRPYWKKIDVEVPSCEVYKILIESYYPMEFIGIIVDEEPKVSISARTS